MPSPPVRLVVAVSLLLLSLTACGKHDSTVDLGLKKVTLDLSFKAKNGATPTLTQVIAAQEPYAPSVQAIGNLVGPVVPPAGISLNAACPTAPVGLLPDVPVNGTVIKPPAAGTYLQHITGTYDLSGALTLKGNLLPFGAMEIANVTDHEGADQLGQEMRTIAYDVIERNVLSTTTTHYESITRDISRTDIKNSPQPVASELEMIWTKTTIGSETTTFTPTPPITVMQYGGEGAQWSSAGIDQDTGTAMVVQGNITKREAIDVCGKMVDTFRVESVERVVNPTSGYTSQTNAASGNVYNVATQFGGLMVRKIVDTTAMSNVGGGSETFVLKSTSTLNSTTPAVKPKA